MKYSPSYKTQFTKEFILQSTARGDECSQKLRHKNLFGLLSYKLVYKYIPICNVAIGKVRTSSS